MLQLSCFPKDVLKDDSHCPQISLMRSNQWLSIRLCLGAPSPRPPTLAHSFLPSPTSLLPTSSPRDNSYSLSVIWILISGSTSGEPNLKQTESLSLWEKNTRFYTEVVGDILNIIWSFAMTLFPWLFCVFIWRFVFNRL